MKKYILEIGMTCMLLVSVFFLSREAAIVSNGKVQEKKVIVVDAGHGGEDPGMIGIGGLEEKGVNLSIAKRLETILEKAGFAVVMTRKEDKGIYETEEKNKKVQDMRNRISLIEKVKPILAVSIHQNSYTQAEVKGPQVFYYEHSEEGRLLAEKIQESLNTGLSVQRPRKAKGNTSYFLLKRSPCVLNIVECGFLTNPEEADLLQTEEYQEKAAQAVAKGILQYLDSY